MEDVLDVYTQPEEPQHPIVCFDETNKQLVDEVRQPLPTVPGQAERYDYEYKRNGVSNLFMFFAPLQGWRHVAVTDQRTKVDYAYCMRDLEPIRITGDMVYLGAWKQQMLPNEHVPETRTTRLLLGFGFLMNCGRSCSHCCLSM